MLLAVLVSLCGFWLVVTVSSMISSSKGVVNLQVKRAIYTGSPVLREEYSIVAGLVDRNRGPVDNYLMVIPPSISSKLVHIGAVAEEGRTPLTITELAIINEEIPMGARCFAINLPKPLTRENSKITFGVALSFVDRWVASPLVASQDSPLNVKVILSPYFYSPYPTLTQKSVVIVIKGFELNSMDCPNPKNLNASKAPSVGIFAGADQYTCGVYENVPPLQEAMGAMWANIRTAQVPWVKVKRLDRTIEPDFLRKTIYVTEEYEFVHVGYHSKNDAFSKLAYIKSFHHMTLRGQTIPIIPISVPASAENIQIRDEIGRLHSPLHRRSSPISKTSHNVEIQPRFPLHGGWSFYQQVTYTLPLPEFISNVVLMVTGKAQQCQRLLMPLFEVFHDIYVEELSIKVIVPGEVQTFGQFPLMTGIETLVQSRTESIFPTSFQLGTKKVYRITFRNLTKEHQVLVAFHFEYAWWVPFRQAILVTFVTLAIMLALGSLTRSGVSLNFGEDHRKILANLTRSIRERRELLRVLDEGDSSRPEKEINAKIEEVLTMSDKICSSLSRFSSDRSLQLATTALKKTYEEQRAKIRQVLVETNPNIKLRLEKDAIDLDDRILQLEAKFISASF